MTSAPAYPAEERSITAILAEDFGITHRGPGTAHELFDRDGKSMGFFTARGACELIERLSADAAASLARSHAAGVAAAIEVHDRIIRAVYADHVFPPSKPLTEMLADCSRLLRAQDAKHAAGHWTASASRRAALAQAEDALLALIAADPLPLSTAA